MQNILILSCLAVMLEAQLKCTKTTGSNSTIETSVAVNATMVSVPNNGTIDFTKPFCGRQAGGKTCEGSLNGPCCSDFGFCGSTPFFCHSEAKCQSGCKDEKLTYSVTQECGILNNKLPCPPNGPFGSCCSPNGYCGNSADHCKK